MIRIFLSLALSIAGACFPSRCVAADAPAFPGIVIDHVAATNKAYIWIAIAAVRTAHDDRFEGANHYHNSNYITFCRVENFRRAAK